MRFTLALALLPHSLVAAPPLETIKKELIKWEGYRLTPYRDGSHWSVGIGHNLTAHKQPIRRYSKNEVDQFFYSDIAWCIDVCRKGIRNFDDLPEQAQIVCISLAMGVGRNGFMGFKNFRACMSVRAFELAAVELEDSKWAKQVGRARVREHTQVLRKLSDFFIDKPLRR